MRQFRFSAASGLLSAVSLMTVGGGGAIVLSAAPAGSTPQDVTIDLLLDICAAPTVEIASAKGDTLGWRRLSSAQLDEWRRHFLSNNGGTVDVVGWRHDADSKDESLSFWIAAGPNGHRACAYSTNYGARLTDAMAVRLGTPDRIESNDATESITAFWKRGSAQMTLAKIGSHVVINVARER